MRLIRHLESLTDKKRSQVTSGDDECGLSRVRYAELTMLYWNVGRRINKEILGEQRADYGKRVVAELSANLMAEHGEIWNEKHLRRVMRFAAVFPDEKIVASLMRQLSWTHLLGLLPIDDPLKREFYIEMCKMAL